MTGRAGFPARQFNLFLTAKDSFLEGNRQIIAQISTTLSTTTSLGTGTCAGKKRLKDIVDTAKATKVAKATGPHATHTIHTSMSVAIISSTLLWIAEDFISFVDFDKASLRSLLLVGIRMILFFRGEFVLLFLLLPGYSHSIMHPGVLR